MDDAGHLISSLCDVSVFGSKQSANVGRLNECQPSVSAAYLLFTHSHTYDDIMSSACV